MPSRIVTDTSPLLYLHRIDALGWLSRLFQETLVPESVIVELDAGRRLDLDVPDPRRSPWMLPFEPRIELPGWVPTELGPGERAVIAGGLENSIPVLLDDRLARQAAKRAGLEVWGTLRILLEAKKAGWVDRIAPWVDQLAESGMWIGRDVRHRVLNMANEEGIAP